MFRMIKHLLFSPEDPGGGGGGAPAAPAAPAAPVTPTPSPLFDDPPAPAAPANPANPAAPAAPAPTVTIPENWKDALPPELKDVPALAKFKTIPDVIKSYTNLEKMMGQEKVAIPQKGAPPEEMRAVLEKLGVPKNIEEYKVEIAPEIAEQMDKDFFEGFRKAAHEQGIFPAQAKALTEWFAKVNTEAYQAQVQAATNAQNLGLKKLEGEWGEAYQENVAKAKAALREFATPEEQKFIRESGLGNNPTVIKILSKMGATLSEAKIKGEGGTGGNIFTPSQAQEKINAIKSNVDHAYWHPTHAGHAEAKKEMASLYEMAKPGKSATQTSTAKDL